MESQWKYWVNEPIFLDAGISNILKRKQAYYLFCKEGLIPLFEDAGYRFSESPSYVTKKLLRLMFTVWKGLRVQPYRQECDFEEEQTTTFYYELDGEVWTSFWKQWQGFQDFDTDRFAYSFRYQLPAFLWSWVDVYNSPRAIQLEKELQDIVTEEEISKGRDDPYLQETHQRDYQDRHWH